MRKILILVEGQTEEKFVKEVLTPYLQEKEVYIVPTIMVTKRVKDGANFKGGIRNYEAIRYHLNKLFASSDYDVVTTMIDFYGLPSDFPGTVLDTMSAHEKVVVKEQAFENEVSNQKFIPYLQLHEFEALLFSGPEKISQVSNIPGMEASLLEIRASVDSPEEINSGYETAPSRRLLKLWPGYKKVLFGYIISKKIGLDTIRSQCPHFNNWIVKLIN